MGMVVPENLKAGTGTVVLRFLILGLWFKMVDLRFLILGHWTLDTVVLRTSSFIAGGSVSLSKEQLVFLIRTSWWRSRRAFVRDVEKQTSAPLLFASLLLDEPHLFKNANIGRN